MIRFMRVDIQPLTLIEALLVRLNQDLKDLKGLEGFLFNLDDFLNFNNLSTSKRESF